MSVVDPAVTATGFTCLLVAMIMYVVDWIADQRERRHEHEVRMNGQVNKATTN